MERGLQSFNANNDVQNHPLTALGIFAIIIYSLIFLRLNYYHEGTASNIRQWKILDGHTLLHKASWNNTKSNLDKESSNVEIMSSGAGSRSRSGTVWHGASEGCNSVLRTVSWSCLVIVFFMSINVFRQSQPVTCCVIKGHCKLES